MKPSRWTLIEVLSFLGVALFLVQITIPAVLTANRLSYRSGGTLGWSGWIGVLLLGLLAGFVLIVAAWLASVAVVGSIVWLATAAVRVVRGLRRPR